MADISLDEFIRKGNIKVRVSNTQQGKGKVKPQKNVSVPNRNGGIRPPAKNIIDARQRLGPKPLIDARDKIIINKKSGVGDARNKIVQKQVQKGTFDARSLLQRQARKIQGKANRTGNFTVSKNQAGNVGTLQLHRTLSNPAAQGKAQVRVTDSGLLITRPVQKSLVALSAGGSIQVTSKLRPKEGNFASAIPIIQIRNDKYRQPAQQSSQQSQPLQMYSNPPTRPSPFADYRSSGYPHATYSTHSSGYRDYDNPQFNEASIAIPEIPKINFTNVRPLEVGGMKPVPYMKEYAQPRVPPGAATVSQGAKPPVSKTVLQPSKLVQAGVKRKPEQDVSGPLRLGRGGGPGIDLGAGDSTLNKKMKVSAIDMDVIDIDSEAEVISPLQGYRVMVTNLYSGVTQDDIIELFGAVGPLKKAKLLKPGSAEVVYVSKDDAFTAVQKYHSRELDGQPMYVKMTTPVGAVVKKAVGDNDPDITGEALRLYRKTGGTGSLLEAPIEIPTIHRALFKAGPPGPNKSVKFTVKI